MTIRLSGAGAVVFDGDDTLWETEPLYDAARDAARRLVENLGLDGSAWEVLQREIDVANLTVHGLGIGRFPLSCVQAYEQLCKTAEATVTHEARTAISTTARAVFTSVAPVYRESGQLLEQLQPDWHLVLCTRGDPEVQQARISASGLEVFFDHIAVVPQKSEGTFRELLAEVDALPERSWSVGNSVRSDIDPATAAGMSAIWVPANVWEGEQSEPPAPSPCTFTVDSLSGVLNLITGGGTDG